MAYKAKEEAVSPPNRLGPSKSAASAPERLGVRAERAGPLAHRESRGHWRLGSSSGAAYPPGSRGPLREVLLPQSRRMSKTPYPAPTSPEDQIAAWLLSVCLCRPPAGHYIGPTSGGSTRWEHARHGWVGAGVGGGSGQKGAGSFYQQSPASTTRLRHEASVRGECYKQKKAPHIARPRRMPPAQSKKRHTYGQAEAATVVEGWLPLCFASTEPWKRGPVPRTASASGAGLGLPLLRQLKPAPIPVHGWSDAW